MNEMQLLEKLLNMVGNAGEGAFTLAILFISKDYFSSILLSIIGFYFINKVYHILIGISFLIHIASLCGCSIPLVDFEKKKISRIIEKGLEKEGE
jgi:hypothetical protein